MNISAIGVKPYSTQNRNKNQNVAFGANFTEGLEIVTQKRLFGEKFRKQVQALIDRPDGIWVKIERAKPRLHYILKVQTESGELLRCAQTFSGLKKHIRTLLQPEEKDGRKVYNSLEAKVIEGLNNGTINKFSKSFEDLLGNHYSKDCVFLAQLAQINSRTRDGLKVSARSLEKGSYGDPNFRLSIETTFGTLTRYAESQQEFKELVLGLLKPSERDGRKVRESINDVIEAEIQNADRDNILDIIDDWHYRPR